MAALDDCYVQLLKVGFLLLRKASDENDTEWVAKEVEHLHNIPSLIGDQNTSRHRFYWDKERVPYMEWVKANASQVHRELVEAMYHPIWDSMEGQAPS